MAIDIFTRFVVSKFSDVIFLNVQSQNIWTPTQKKKLKSHLNYQNDSSPLLD